MDDILEQIADLIPGCHRYSNYLSCCCLFHDEHHPSMFIYSDWYKCSSCGAYGKTASLLAKLEGKPVRTSQKSFHPHLWNYLDEDVDVESLAITAHHRYELNPDVGYYFKQRGIASEAKRLLFGYLDGWYTFPVLGEHHEIQGLVARAGHVAEQNYGVRYVVPPKQAPMLYVPDWNLVAESPYVFLTLGIIDAISVSLAGFPAVSGTAGHFLPVEMFDKMRKLIYILPDGDGKDFKVSRKLATELGWRGKIAELPYPDGTKDCNDIMTRKSVGDLGEILQNVIQKNTNHIFVIR
jgi:hypothetical protein